MIDPRHIKWLEARGIRSDIAETMGLSTVVRHDKGWLSIPYKLDGRLVNRKYRCTSEKLHEMDKGGTLCLWNAEALSSGANVIITEGEFDALAAMSAGFKHVVSVPNGTSATSNPDPFTGNAYGYMWQHEAPLKEVKSFVLATDGDAPGIALARALAAILGPERCRFVDYPEGCKDLNEVLVAHGQAALVRVVNEAKPFPVLGLYSMEDFPDAQELPAMDTGIPALDESMCLVLGSLTVFSGYSNMGKSTVLNSIVAHCLIHSVPVCIASFETAPKPILRDGIARAMIGCSFEAFLSHPQRQAAYNDIDRQLTVISNALDDDSDIDLERYIELARIAVVRDGAKLVILDPWNEIEHKRGRDETETDYIGRAIRALKRFAKRYNVALWVVAHPSKPQGKTGAPGLYDISGSANWANKADYGLIYHRPDKTVNEGTLSVVKVRMGFPGQCAVIPVMMDNGTSRIVGRDL